MDGEQDKYLCKGHQITRAFDMPSVWKASEELKEILSQLHSAYRLAARSKKCSAAAHGIGLVGAGDLLDDEAASKKRRIAEDGDVAGAGGQAAHDVQVYRSKMLSEASEEHCRTVQLLEVPLNTETNDIVASVKANLLWQRHQGTWRGGTIRLLVLSVTALAEGSQPFRKPAGIGAVLNPFPKTSKGNAFVVSGERRLHFQFGFLGESDAGR